MGGSGAGGGKVFALCEEDIHGQIHWSLSLRFGTNMIRFGRLLEEYVKQKIVIRRGAPPAAAMAFKRHVLRLCLSHGPRLLARKLCLLQMANGDWRRKDEITVFLPDHAEYDANVVKATVAQAMRACLAGARPSTYPRHRWTGAEAAWSEWCLLEAVHGLGSAVWALYCQGPQAVASSAAGGAPGGGSALAPDMQLAIADDGSMLAVAPAFADGLADGSAATQSIDTARAQQDTHRREASLWLMSDRLAPSLIIRQTLEPLRQLLAEQLDLGSKAWHRRQERAEAQRLASCGEGSREWPVTVACSGCMERRAQERMWMLLDDVRMWQDLIPIDQQTVRLRSLTFRLLSTADALVETVIAQPHRQYPLKMFTLLAGAPPSDVADDPPCMMDPWSLSFVADFSGIGLGSMEALSYLRTIASMIRLNISDIEASHASIRRRLHVRGVQTHPEGIEEVSAEFVLDKLRHAGLPWKADPFVKDNRGSDADGASQTTAKSKGRGRAGGPWRAFVRQDTMGKRGGLRDMPAVSERYHQLTDAEKKQLELIGKAATQQGRPTSGPGSSFGLRPRELARLQEQALTDARADREALSTGGAGLDRNASIDHAIAHAVREQAGGNTSVEDLLRSARGSLRKAQRQSMSQVADDEAFLATWRESAGAEIVRETLGQAPGLRPYEALLQPSPCSGQALLKVLHPVQTTAAIAGMIDESHRSTNLGRCMDSVWVELHKPVLQSECKPIQEPKSTQTMPKCSTIGACLCGPTGRSIQSMRKSFYAYLKQVCQKGGLEFDLLRGRCLIVRVQCADMEVEEECPWSVALRSEAVEAEPTTKDMWFHIAHHVFKPYGSTFRRLDFVRESEVQGRTEVLLKVGREVSMHPFPKCLWPGGHRESERKTPHVSNHV